MTYIIYIIFIYYLYKLFRFEGNRHQRAQRCDEVDRVYGYERYTESVDRIGWLINIHPVWLLLWVYYISLTLQADMLDEDKRLVSAVDFYFIEEDGGRFKVTLPYQPYFYISTVKDAEREVTNFLSRKLSGRLAGIDLVRKEDLDMVSKREEAVSCHYYISRTIWWVTRLSI